ncbi:G2/mitotic-specific cyclin-1 like [Actinidia chinensis var. chinensis]|uniref:G2/mitotic-specific cyclin-1 like n=1 Tax=Actinidia chinensis var. chinensis TaxID=1590841 RepID=A0A2R6R734_ACTCC|nr:G2/mitotic-specific cyclin-1 like [Actinidia chinensis var. chinensis]
MGRSDENNNSGAVMKPSNSQGGSRMGCPRFQQQKINHRRALTNINQNILGLSQKDVNGAKNNGLPSLCPITGKFAAQWMTNQQPCPKENKDPSLATLNSNGVKNCAITYMEKCDEAIYDPVPMFVKHTEAMMDEIDRMVEVEMEDVDDDPVLDIDSSDGKNPLAVVEYIEDIYAHYRETEDSARVSPYYMTHQFDINEKMRAILIDWLIEVHYKFDLMEETLFLTVNLIDRFLECETVVRKKLQLVGVTAMLLACKYEEVSVPLLEDFVIISDQAYIRKDLLHMEKLMVNALQFNMSVPTPYVFMRRFLKAAQSNEKLELLSFFIIELCLVEYEMLKFPPSLLAAAAIFTAQCSLYGSKQWTKAIEWHTNYSEDQLMDCSRLMVTYHQRAGTGKLKGVYKKYSLCKFGYAAKSEPAQFLLDLSLP